MKTSFVLSVVSSHRFVPTFASLLFGAVTLASAAPEEVVVAERGPHHRVIERTVEGRKSSYTELATGLHYWKDGQWHDSREEVEILNGVAVARQGQHQVIFAANLNSPGAIDMLSPDGKRFRSHVLGLAYTDYASGNSVMIAEVKDSIGAVQQPNRVIYQDAFSGDCTADVRYTYTLGGFEQDVILLTAPPSPAEWNLNPDTTRLEVWTEFIELPEGTATPVILKQESDPIARQNMVEPDLIDHRLDFGVMKFEQGQAFPLGDPDPFNGSTVPTGKSMVPIEGRVFLIEKVDHRDIREHLGTLPQEAAVEPIRNRADPVNGRRLMAATRPAPKGARGQWKEKQYAKVDTSRKGFVLDYITINGSLTNLVLKGDTTYQMTNQVDVYGTAVLEGGAVIKSAGARMHFNGPVDCRTSPYRPVTFTSKDDDTIGEIIAGSTGSPAIGGASYRILCADTTITYDLHDLRLFYVFIGIQLNAAVKADLSNLQIGKSRTAIGQVATSIANCRNFLFFDLTVTAYATTGVATNRSENGTLHRISTYRQVTNGVFSLTNSLMIAVTNNVVFTGENNVTNVDDTGYFQTVGAASHYLASGSTNRNAGTTNINLALLAALKKKTTYPPIVLTNDITGDTTLTAQAGRDTDTPDLGYHYDPLDYVAGQIAVTNATLTLQSGAALGVYGASTAPGLVLLDGGKIISEGAPDNLSRVVRYNLVQEQAVATWGTNSVGRSITTVSPYGTNLLTSELDFRFTGFSMPANGNDHLYVGATNLALTVQDCQFHGGSFTAVQPNVTLLNNLFERVAFKLYANVHPFAALVRNATFAGGTVTLSNAVSGGWNFRDNLFDTTNLVQVGFVTNNYNAYLTNSVRLTNNGANDVLLTLTNIAYELGPLGYFYLPTNLTSHSVLFNSGSQNATNSGLYHFTCVTNQTRELSTTVDIGFHYVAVNSSGQPLDTDGDGIADYFEDTNGNGSFDSGETDWEDYNSLNGLTGTPGLQVFTPLK